MKIQIIGFSGSGKSTLAKILSDHHNISVLHLDSVHFYGDWQERTLEEQNAIVLDFMHQHSDWIIDGNYSRVAPKRFEESDLTIFLAYNRFVCYWNAWRRYRKHRGIHRFDCPCIEKFDLEFRYWILVQGRKHKRVQNMYVNFHKTHGTRLLFKNRKQLNRWLKEQNIPYNLSK